MASLGATYDASQGEQMSDRSVLPAGEYLAAIAKSDVSDTTEGRRAQGRPRVRGPRRPAQGPPVLEHAQPLEPEPGDGGDGPARAQLHLPRGRQAAGRRHRGAARHPDAGEARLPEGQRRAQRAEGLQARRRRGRRARPAPPRPRPRAPPPPGAGRGREPRHRERRPDGRPPAPRPADRRRDLARPRGRGRGRPALGLRGLRHRRLGAGHALRPPDLAHPALGVAAGGADRAPAADLRARRHRGGTCARRSPARRDRDLARAGALRAGRRLAARQGRRRRHRASSRRRRPSTWSRSSR